MFLYLNWSTKYLKLFFLGGVLYFVYVKFSMDEYVGCLVLVCMWIIQARPKPNPYLTLILIPAVSSWILEVPLEMAGWWGGGGG
jgi:hypothetical protein